MAAATPLPISTRTQEAFKAYYDQVMQVSTDLREDLRFRFEKLDKQYQREVEESVEHKRAKAANDAGDTTRFQNITVPVVMPQVEAAVTYQTSVFLTGIPLFGVVSSPTYIDEALQLETIIDNQAIRGGWAREFMLFFRDGFKYNFAPLEVTWDAEVSYSVETELATGPDGIPKEVLWEGNKVKRLDPYNTFVDPRVHPTRVAQDGEFAGYTERMSRTKLKMFIEQLPDKLVHNIGPAFATSCASLDSDISSHGYYMPSVNPEVGTDDYPHQLNWLSWAALSTVRKDMEYHDSYDVTTLYCRAIPSEFDLKIPRRNIPQIFKLIIINHQVIIYCERQTNAHNLIPIFIGQPLEDGLGYQTKSLAKHGEQFQQAASAFMNSIIHSRRRAVTDRVLYDPSRISAAHINSDNPSAKIPVRPAAYGKNIAESVYAFPYREDQGAISMQQIQTLIGMANNLTGQNMASQGQFVKGNKTLHEFESVMQNANGRDQMASILLEHQVFMPLKLVLKLNILQYQGGTSLYNRDKQVAIEVDPIQLRRSVLEFKISDGLLPSSKLINADTFQVAMQVIGSSPQIGAGYDIAALFSYLMKTQGAKISEFEKPREQVAYEQAVAQWQQVAIEAAKTGAQVPPQPTPADFGWTPNEANQ